MTVYNLYEGVAIKTDQPQKDTMFTFKVGDKCDLEDGVYLHYDGAVVVKDGVFSVGFPRGRVKTKWRDDLDLNKTLDPYNPVKQAVKQFEGVLNERYKRTSG